MNAIWDPTNTHSLGLCIIIGKHFIKIKYSEGADPGGRLAFQLTEKVRAGPPQGGPWETV